jgi:hypothetical protein
MCDFSFALVEPFWVQNLRIQSVWNKFHQTLDRNIAGGGKEVRAALPRAHDSLP